MAPHPFVKWAGGKSQIFEQVSTHIPSTFRKYFEPFVGGGAMFYGLAAQNRFLGATLADTNSALVSAYITIRDNPDDLIGMLQALPITKEIFEGLRKQHPDTLTPLERAAWLIYLNKTCFNGLFRVNQSGFFNAPWGKYVNPKVCDVENLKAVSALLNHFKVDVQHGDFEATTANAGPDDVVYFDPPYIPLSKTSNFTSYQAGGFGMAEQERLATYFRNLVDKGVHVVLSNSDTELTRALYEGFEMHVVQARRSVNSKGTGRGVVNELVLVGRRSQ